MNSSALLQGSSITRGPITRSRRGAVSSRARTSLRVEARKGIFLKEMMKERDEGPKGFGAKPSEEPKRALPTVTKIEWTSPLDVVKYPDPRLRAVNALVGTFDENLEKLAAEMFEVMYTDDGVGLAAPQVGVNVRLMVFNPEGEKGKGEEIVLVNPKVKEFGKKKELREEGCLSFPKLYGDVERSRAITIQAQDVKGRSFTYKLEGWRARIFQHEYDHLEGRLFVDRMIPEHLEKIRPGLVGMEDSFAQANPGVEIRRIPPPPAPTA